MDSKAIPTPITQITPVTPVTPIIPIFKKINDIYVKSSYLEKYGVDHPSKSEEIKQKKKDTSVRSSNLV